jgi:DNA-binding NarL/FixJ family response regulator
LIRIFIVADTSDRSSALAALLEEDERFEVSDIDLADVIVCAGISLHRLPARGKPVVAISNQSGGDAPFDGTLKAWLPSAVRLEELAAAVAAAAAGLTVLTAQQTQRAFQAVRPPKDLIADAEELTARELQVLQMLASGLANKEIAARLRISLNTAKFHVRQIMAKLNATSRTEAVSSAIRRGLVPI